MAKFLITGGAGFIGSNFCSYMVKRYPLDSFICFDKLTYAGSLDFLKGILHAPNFKFIQGDICDTTSVKSLFEQEKFDIVVNFAAETHVDRSIEAPFVFVESNVVGVQVLLEACRCYGIQRFHQISTDEVYGDLPIEAKERKFKEEDALHPSSPYSASKAAADLLVLSYQRTFGIPITISRCTNNYGPNQNEEKLIPLVIQRAHRNEAIPVYGTGENIRDWINVLDHCRAIDLILKKGKTGQIYNIGGQNERCNLDIIKLVLNKMGKSLDLISFVEDRKGHDLRYSVSCDKIKELGWTPKYEFEECLQSLIEHYKN